MQNAAGNYCRLLKLKKVKVDSLDDLGKSFEMNSDEIINLAKEVLNGASERPHVKKTYGSITEIRFMEPIIYKNEKILIPWWAFVWIFENGNAVLYTMGTIDG